MREVHAFRVVRFLEEITAWQPPSSFDYLIRETTLPIRHESGRITFASEGAGTIVEWRSRFEIPVPIVGGLLATGAKGILTRTFKKFLRQAKVALEA